MRKFLPTAVGANAVLALFSMLLCFWGIAILYWSYTMFGLNGPRVRDITFAQYCYLVLTNLSLAVGASPALLLLIAGSGCAVLFLLRAIRHIRDKD